MKTLCITAILCSFIAVPAISQVTLSSEDLDKIRLIVNDVVKEEIAKSEARLKDYVNIRFDSLEKEINSVDKRVTYSINITYGLIALIVVAIGIPQFISVLQGRHQKELERKIEALEQQRIVTS